MTASAGATLLLAQTEFGTPYSVLVCVGWIEVPSIPAHLTEQVAP